MSTDELTRRIREDIPAPTEEQRARMRRTVHGGLADRGPLRRPSRVRSAIALTTAIAGFAAFFVLALPKGDDTGPPAAPAEPAFAVLQTGDTFDLATVKLTPEQLRFPGLQPGSLRLARTLSVGTNVIVGRASNNFVCLILVPPRQKFRQAACAPARDVGAAALTQFAWWGKRETVVLVADGTQLTGTDGRSFAVRRNVAVVPKGVRRVAVTGADGTRRELRLAEGKPVPLLPADARRLKPVVPDLTGLTTDQATGVLYAARLADGPVDPRPLGDASPGTVVGQAIQPGTEVADGTEVGLVAASPAGPGGERIAVPLDTPIRWRQERGAPPASAFADGTFGDLAGRVRVLLFARTRAQAAQVKWVDTATIVVRDDERGASDLVGDPRWSLVADRDGRLASVVGVTQLPTIVVLDRVGRVAYREPGVPTALGRGGPGDLGELTSVLRKEPYPAGSAPAPPAGAWFMTERVPVSPDRVPTYVRSFFRCPVHPERVWELGPTPSGWRAWVGLSTERPSGTGVDIVAITTRGVPRGSRAGAGSGGCGYSLDGRNSDVAVGISGWSGGGRTGSIWIVRKGYTRAVADRRTWPVANGLLVIQGKTAPKSFTLIGPAGRREVRP